jgi:antitoxin YefM
MYVKAYVLESDMTTVTATKARQNLFGLLKHSVKGHAPVRIHSKAGDAVLVSEADYEGLLETLELLSTHGFKAAWKRARADIKTGRTKSLKEVFGG